MLTYDKKQMIQLHRWLLPAVLFVFVVMIARLDVLVEALQEKGTLSYGWTLQFVNETLQSEAALLAAPVLCTFPYAAVFVDELKSGMVKAVLVRVEKERYIASKVWGCLLSGGLEALVSVGLLCLIAVVGLLHLEAAPDPGVNQSEAIRMLIGLACRYACFGAFWSLVGFGISLLTMNRMMAWIGPFIVDYLLIIMYERYFDGLKLFYPKQWLLQTWEWPLGDGGVCLWMLLLCGPAVLMVRHKGRKVLNNAL